MVDFLGVPLNIPSISLTGLALLIVAGVVRALIVGTLLPRSVLEDLRADRDERIEEWKTQAEIWRNAYNESQATVAVLNDQTARLMELSEATIKTLRSLPVDTGEGNESDS